MLKVIILCLVKSIFLFITKIYYVTDYLILENVLLYISERGKKGIIVRYIIQINFQFPNKINFNSIISKEKILKTLFRTSKLEIFCNLDLFLRIILDCMRVLVVHLQNVLCILILFFNCYCIICVTFKYVV